MIEIPPLPAEIAYDQWCVVEGEALDYTHAAYRGKSGENTFVPYFPYGTEEDGTPKRVPCFVLGVNSPAAPPSVLRPSDISFVIILCPVPEDKEALNLMVQRGYRVSVYQEKTSETSVDYVGSSRPDVFKGHVEIVCNVK